MPSRGPASHRRPTAPAPTREARPKAEPPTGARPKAGGPRLAEGAWRSLLHRFAHGVGVYREGPFPSTKSSESWAGEGLGASAERRTKAQPGWRFGDPVGGLPGYGLSDRRRSVLDRVRTGVPGRQPSAPRSCRATHRRRWQGVCLQRCARPADCPPGLGCRSCGAARTSHAQRRCPVLPGRHRMGRGPRRLRRTLRRRRQRDARARLEPQWQQRPRDADLRQWLPDDRGQRLHR